MAVNATFARLEQIVAPIWRNNWSRRCGIAILIGLSLLFLVLAIRDASSADILSRTEEGDAAAIVLGGGVYALLLVLLARGWSLAPGSVLPEIGYRQAIAVYGTSILPKYIPGSMLQYGSRQLLGQRLGWDARMLAQASVLEVTLHVVCSLAVALVLLAPLAGKAAMDGMFWYVAAISIALAAALVALVVFRRSVSASVMIGSTLFQLAFFAGLAGLAMLCGYLFGVTAEALPAVGGLFLLSWLIGFVVPLAPGGLGVREAAGVALLSGLIGVESALLIQASMRIISLIGDVLIFLAGLACQRTLHLSSR